MEFDYTVTTPKDFDSAVLAAQEEIDRLIKVVIDNSK